VSNLAWKLALAVKCPDKAAILDTYGPERRPHAREFIDLAVQMGQIIQVVDPKIASTRDAELKAKGLSFQFPRPTLGKGAHTGKENLVGKVAPQPILSDGRWFDDVVGQQFSLLIDSTQAQDLSADTKQKLDELGIVVISNGGVKAQTWLTQNKCVAALIRPDRYVFDTATTVADVNASIDQLARWIAA
jgi:3-(3-hydroxy-phenyl)propionate hydroxylase